MHFYDSIKKTDRSFLQVTLFDLNYAEIDLFVSNIYLKYK